MADPLVSMAPAPTLREHMAFRVGELLDELRPLEAEDRPGDRAELLLEAAFDEALVRGLQDIPAALFRPELARADSSVPLLNACCPELGVDARSNLRETLIATLRGSTDYGYARCERVLSGLLAACRDYGAAGIPANLLKGSS